MLGTRPFLTATHLTLLPGNQAMEGTICGKHCEKNCSLNAYYCLRKLDNLELVTTLPYCSTNGVRSFCHREVP